MTLRERALVTAALLAAILMVWMMSILDPVTAKQRALVDEMSTLQASISSATASMEASGSDETSVALAKEQRLQASLADINAKLASTSAGLIPPERMVQVIHDVLAGQHGITLISLHNEPVTTLVEATQSEAGASPSESAGPYMHPVELVLEGRYLDVLTYLHALEALPWHFYWKVLELETTEYPTNRVRIELSTLSMDKEWLGV
jgi:MSHA biogenesis protein MshJ